MKTFKSDISQKEYLITEKVCANIIRKNIFEYIKKDFSGFNAESCLALSELNKFREKYLSDYMNSHIQKLSDLEAKTFQELSDKTSILEKVNDIKSSTLGQRLADNVATFGGSWKFIIIFGAFLVVWIFSNIVFLSNKGFDPYPFILLNLILSCLAAIQAPIIMMSQNRQEEKDRDRAKEDFIINLKSEMEVRVLHDKIDHLMIYQQQELLEIQQIQIEMMNDILKKLEK